MAGFDFSKYIGAVKDRVARATEAATRAVDEFGEHVLCDAQQLTPVGGGSHSPRDPAPGTLQGSGTSTPAAVEGDRIVKAIGFNTEYAAVQHENEEFGHDVGQAKYLYDALANNAPKMGPFVASRVKAAVES